MKQSWTVTEAPEIGWCDCDNRAPMPKRRNGGHGSYPVCDRCRELERNPVMDERVGFTEIWDIPRGDLERIRRACDVWLRARGLREQTGHSYIELL